MNYLEKLRDPRWQIKRLEVMERDGFSCFDCRSSEKTLTVHHCRYERNPWDVSSEFLMTLCESCHRERQAIERDLMKRIQRRFADCTTKKLKAILGNIFEKADEECAAIQIKFGQSEVEKL